MSSASGREVFGAGALSRRVTLLAGTAGRDALGGQKITYAQLGPDKVWAELTESAAANATGNARFDGHAWPHRIRIRAKDGVATPLRVELDDGRIVQIEGIARLGRRYLLLAGMELGSQQP